MEEPEGIEGVMTEVSVTVDPAEGMMTVPDPIHTHVYVSKHAGYSRYEALTIHRGLAGDRNAQKVLRQAQFECLRNNRRIADARLTTQRRTSRTQCEHKGRYVPIPCKCMLQSLLAEQQG